MIRHSILRATPSPFVLAALVMALAGPAPGQTPAPDPAEALRRATPTELLVALRLRPLPPATSAPEARLTMLHPSPGERVSLSRDDGEDWILIAFAAGWCQPCLDQLPALQALHDLDGLSVRVVVVDELGEAQRSALADAGISFDVLVDGSGEVATAYAVSSLPAAYLVRRPGAVVGLLRGLRDPSSEVPVFAELLRRDLELEPVEFASAPLALPAELEAPTARVVSAPDTVRPGEDFVVDVRIDWSGELDSYVPQAPDVVASSADGVEVERVGVAARSRGEAGRGLVDYSMTWRAEGEGELTLDPILVRHVPRYEGLQLFARAEGVRIAVASPAGLGWWPVAVGALALLALALAVWSRRRRSADEDVVADPFESWRRELDLARRARLDGSFEAALEALVRVGEGLREHDSDAAQAAGELALLSEQVRFGGVVPPGDELDRIHRLLERSCERLRPDPSAAEREALQLQ